MADKREKEKEQVTMTLNSKMLSVVRQMAKDEYRDLSPMIEIILAVGLTTQFGYNFEELIPKTIRDEK